MAARFAADVMGVPTIVLARTDAEAANLLTSNCDANDHAFITGERTQEGFYRVKMAWSKLSAVVSATLPTPIWCGAKRVCRISALPVNLPKPYTLPALASCCRTTARLRSTGRKTSTTAKSLRSKKSCRPWVYKFQFITLAGIHINWYNTFQFAHAYARGEGMKHYVNMVQEPEFAAREQGYTFVSHQQEVAAGYFDDVTTVIQGGSSSVKALTRFDRRRTVPLSTVVARSQTSALRKRNGLALQARLSLSR